MYIIIPLIFVITGIVGVSVIIFRKLPYLRKLDPDQLVLDGNGHQYNAILFLREMFPEVFSFFNEINIKEYKQLWLAELEKMLRRLRLVSLKVDRISEGMIKRVRREHKRTAVQAAADAVQDQQVTQSTVQPAEPLVDDKEIPKLDPEELKKEEQKIIIEIAKNPKDPDLYMTLGDLYMKLEVYSDARDSFEAALELRPESTMLKHKLNEAKEKLGEGEAKTKNFSK